MPALVRPQIDPVFIRLVKFQNSNSSIAVISCRDEHSSFQSGNLRSKSLGLSREVFEENLLRA